MHNIETTCNNTTYCGIKKLWKDEAEFWKSATMPEYSLYKIPNSNYKSEEYWLIEAHEDLQTLKKYLVDVGRPKDFEKKQNLTK